MAEFNCDRDDKGKIMGIILIPKTAEELAHAKLVQQREEEHRDMINTGCTCDSRGTCEYCGWIEDYDEELD